MGRQWPFDPWSLRVPHQAALLLLPAQALGTVLIFVFERNMVSWFSPQGAIAMPHTNKQRYTEHKESCCKGQGTQCNL